MCLRRTHQRWTELLCCSHSRVVVIEIPLLLEFRVLVCVCSEAYGSGSSLARPSGGMDAFWGLWTFLNVRDNEGIYIFGQTLPLNTSSARFVWQSSLCRSGISSISPDKNNFGDQKNDLLLQTALAGGVSGCIQSSGSEYLLVRSIGWQEHT